ncbi:MAG: glycosyltransferase family 39 protein [Candidatus Eisenbacteria bacterium]
MLRLAAPGEPLYPVEGDSEKYETIANGFARLFSHPAEGFRLWIGHAATAEELRRYGFDSWVLAHAPAYTALLGLVHLLPGDDVAAGRAVTTLLFVLGAPLLFLLGRALFSPGVGLAAALLYLFWPAHWFYAPAILTELPVAFAALATSYALLKTGERRSRRGWIAGGAVLALLVLTKTTLRYLAIPWILLEALLDRPSGGREALLRAGYRFAGYMAVQLLWLSFLWGFGLSANPLAKTGDDWMWIYRGNYVPDRGWETVGAGDAYTPEVIAALEKIEGVPEGQRNAALYRAAFFQTLENYPGGMAALVLSKASIFWIFPAVKTYVSAGPLSLPPPARVQPALAVAALLGIALCCVGGPRKRWLPLAFPVYLTLLHASTHLVSRYDVPAIPFAMLYGSAGMIAMVRGARGAIGKASSGRAAERGRALLASFRPWLVPAGAAIAGSIAGLLLLSLKGSGPAALAPWVAAAGWAPLAARLFGGGSARVAWIRAAVFLAPLALFSSALIANDPDPDERIVRLDRAGEGVALTLELPGAAAPELFEQAQLDVDLLASPRGRFDLSFRVNGTEVERFRGRPESSEQAFLLDPQIHSLDHRYDRIVRSMRRHLEGFVRRHAGMRDAGWDVYRQWYRIPVDPKLAFGSSKLRLEVVLASSDGGSVDLFLDRRAPERGDPDPQRIVRMPAFFENAYELSSYRFDALASRPRLADSRLVRPIPIFSRRIAAERIEPSGRAVPIDGEPRIRLRGRLPGAFGLMRVQGSQSLIPAWVSDPSQMVRPLDPQEIRVFQSQRDDYDDGWVTF